MESAQTRMGSRSSTRHGPATVFTGRVRRWQKKWTRRTPTDQMLVYKWTPAATSATSPADAVGGKQPATSQKLRFLPVSELLKRRVEEASRAAAAAAQKEEEIKRRSTEAASRDKVETATEVAQVKEDLLAENAPDPMNIDDADIPHFIKGHATCGSHGESLGGEVRDPTAVEAAGGTLVDMDGKGDEHSEEIVNLDDGDEVEEEEVEDVEETLAEIGEGEDEEEEEGNIEEEGSGEGEMDEAEEMEAEAKGLPDARGTAGGEALEADGAGTNDRLALEGEEEGKDEKGERNNLGEKHEEGERDDSGEKNDSGVKDELGEKNDSAERDEVGERDNSGERDDLGEKVEIGERNNSAEKDEVGERDDSGEKDDLEDWVMISKGGAQGGAAVHKGDEALGVEMAEGLAGEGAIGIPQDQTDSVEEAEVLLMAEERES